MQYALIGHPCKDKTDDGYRWGGPVVYSGIMAAQLGADAHILTRCQVPPPDIDRRLQWHIDPDPHTTTYENTYDQYTGQRKQILHARAANISTSRLNVLQPAADLIHLAPVANEVELDQIPALKRGAWLVATPQGWMRRTYADGVTYHVKWEAAEALLPHLHALALSDEDVNHDIALVRYYASIVPYVLYTVGLHGAVLFHGDDQTHIDAEPANVVDPTGAGDVIATAFFVRLRETNNPVEAVRFGTLAAALAIEGEGISGIPSRQQIAERRRRSQH